MLTQGKPIVQTKPKESASNGNPGVFKEVWNDVVLSCPAGRCRLYLEYVRFRPGLPSPPASQSAAAVRESFPSDSRIGYVDVEKVAALSREGKSATAQLEALRTRNAAEVASRANRLSCSRRSCPPAVPSSTKRPSRLRRPSAKTERPPS